MSVNVTIHRITHATVMRFPIDGGFARCVDIVTDDEEKATLFFEDTPLAEAVAEAINAAVRGPLPTLATPDNDSGLVIFDESGAVTAEVV